MSRDPGVWLAALLTIMVFSYLWRENVLFRIAEHIFIGTSAGYLLCITWSNVLKPKLVIPLMSGNILSTIVPLLMILLLLGRLSKQQYWWSHLPMAFLLGFTGYAIPAILDASLLQQIQATVNVSPGPSILAQIGAATLVFGTIACLIHFHSSHLPGESFPAVASTLTGIRRAGAFILMVSFGAGFGYTVMARLSLLIGRLTFLLRDWLGVIT